MKAYLCSRYVWLALVVFVSSAAVEAAPLKPTSWNVEFAPPGSNDVYNPLQPEGPYQDDVFLQDITFNGVTYSEAGGQIVAVQSAYVLANRQNANAEFGDNDTNSDGNPDPFTRVGLNPLDKESVVPKIQDTAIASAFSTLSLNEGLDGEPATGSNQYNIALVFTAGVSDNNNGSDAEPEFMLFERGNNDTTTLRAIIGGTFDNPTFADNAIVVQSGDFEPMGFEIDTSEISQGQELSVLGIDISDFFTSYSGQTIWGLSIESTGGDFYGKMLGAENPLTQLDYNVPLDLINPNGAIPEPATLLLLIAGSGILLKRRSLQD